MKIDSLVFMLSEYSHAPQALPEKIVTHEGISNYTNRFPDVCREYVEQAKISEACQIGVDPKKSFYPSQHKSTDSNGMVASCYAAISVYPDGSMWSHEDFINLLNIIQFDVALYLFSIFYQIHSDNPRFYLDFKRYLIDKSPEVKEMPFFRNFYTLNKLFTIYKVNELLHTDIIKLFIKETMEINLK